jgi:hypothetical protein
MSGITWSKCFRRKPLEAPLESQLKRTLTSVDLLLYGVGSSVGAGIYCLVGIGAGLVDVNTFSCTEPGIEQNLKLL